MECFKATLEPVPHGGSFIVVPAPVAAAAGVTTRDRVRGTVDRVPFRSALAKYSGVFHLLVPKEALGQAGKTLGQEVTLTIERDDEPLPGDSVPQDLALALEQAGVGARLDKLAPSLRRTWVKSVLDAKKSDTRQRRIEKLIALLRG